MNELVYELFSGVGFCNQLFSLETGIYLSNILERKLILLIRHPLCHIGRCSWNYGRFTDFFEPSIFDEILPYGYEFYYYQSIPKLYEFNGLEEESERMDLNSRFSHVGFIDKDLDKPQNSHLINKFLHGRTKFVFDKNMYKKKYLIVDKSNAARCFSNFFTTKENYKLMCRICQCFTHFNPYIENLIRLINFDSEDTLAIHFRFGDRKYSTNEVDKNSLMKYDRFRKQVHKLVPKSRKVYVMADRKDAFFLKKLSEECEVIYVTDLVEEVIGTVQRNIELIQFILEMSICIKSSLFVGYEGSTVSHFIHYNHFLKGSQCYEYTERSIDHRQPYSWNYHNVCGPSIVWKVFFPDNIMESMPKIITLTNDGYMRLTENLLISMKKLGIAHKLKIYCIGSKCYDFFRMNHPYNEIVNLEADQELSKFVEYRSLQNKDIDGKKKWAKITSYKIHVIHLELIQGNDVIFTDGDIVWYKNPIPYLLNNIGDYELLVQNDETEEKKRMCSGFFLLKSNENTIKFTDVNNINMSHFPNDQQYLRSVKSNHKFLPLDLFPHGLHFRQKRPEEPYIVHFNYDVGFQKIERMKRFDAWYLDKIGMTTYDPNSSKLNAYLQIRNIKVKQGYLTDDFQAYCVFDKEFKHILKDILNKEDEYRNVLQIGFLAGHSAEYFLSLSNLMKVTSIDSGDFQSVRVGHKFLTEEYPERSELLIGKSQKILPELVSKKMKYDIILIDGSFSKDDVKCDVELCKFLSHPDTLLIVNNVMKNRKMDKYWTTEFSEQWYDKTKNNYIQEISQLDISVGRGIAFGKYI
tara:strand:+ start:12956 stop:15367 length:2412 start_codon:yes stop_codon:yes gene_type:complete